MIVGRGWRQLASFSEAVEIWLKWRKHVGLCLIVAYFGLEIGQRRCGNSTSWRYLPLESQTTSYISHKIQAYWASSLSRNQCWAVG
jgi:hypothetical protein